MGRGFSNSGLMICRPYCHSGSNFDPVFRVAKSVPVGMDTRGLLLRRRAASSREKELSYEQDRLHIASVAFANAESLLSTWCTNATPFERSMTYAELLST
jgi:hypothetical protein